MSVRPLGAPLRVEAEIFHRRMSAGRNGALYISTRDASGALVDAIVKLPLLAEGGASFHPVPSLLEWLGCALAGELGVRTPAPLEVVFDAGFARCVADSTVRGALAGVEGTVFGSTFTLGSVPARADLLKLGDLRGAAVTLVAFDVFIHNSDRRDVNPNLFVDREGPIAFDHEMAFGFHGGMLIGVSLASKMEAPRLRPDHVP